MRISLVAPASENIDFLTYHKFLLKYVINAR